MTRLSVLLILTFCYYISTIHGGVKKTKDPLLEEFSSLPTKATFYEEEYFNGLSTSIESAECKNLPRRWQKRAQSVDTLGTCVTLCEEIDCTGRCVRIYPNHGDLQLSTVEMDAKVSSARSCFRK